MNFIEISIIIFFISFLLIKVFQKIKIPIVLAPIISGVIIQILSQKDFIDITEAIFTIKDLAQFGTMALLFYITLNFDFEKLKKSKNETIMIAFFNIILSFVFGIFITKFLFSDMNLSYQTSILISVALAISAESIALFILEENKLSKSRIGEIILAAGVINNILIIMFLLTYSTIFTAKSPLEIYTPLILGFLSIAMIFLFLKNITQFLRRLFVKESEEHKYNLFTFTIVFFLLISVYFDLIGFDYNLGSIIAGLLLNMSLSKKIIEIEEKENILKMFKTFVLGFLSIFFFFWVGYKFSFKGVLNVWEISLILVIAGFSVKVLGGLISAYFSKDKLKNGFLIGLVMSPKGTSGIVIATIGLEYGIINENIFSAIILMGISLTIISPLIFKKTYSSKMS